MSQIFISFIDHDALNHKFYSQFIHDGKKFSTCYWSGIYPRLDVEDLKNCSFLANMLLCYDTCIVTVDDYLYLVKTLGYDIVNTMLREDAIQIYNNQELRASIFAQSDELPMILQFSRNSTITPDVKVREYQKIYGISYQDKYKPNLEKDIDEALEIKLDTAWFDLLNQEISTDLQNPKLLSRLELVNAGKIIDRDSDHNQYLYNRIAYLNQFLAIRNQLGITNMLLPPEIQELLDVKLGAFLSAPSMPVYTNFSSIIRGENISDLSSLVADNILSFEDILRIRQSKHSVDFRKWLDASTLTSPDKDIIDLYNSAVKEGIPLEVHETIPKKIFKWAVPLALDAIPFGNTLNGILGAISLVTDIFPKKFYPNIFINDHLKKEIDEKMLKNKFHTENKSFIQKYGVIQRNTPCPCGSNKKYKNCHGG